MHLFSDIANFIKTLTFVDYVFFFAVVILLVLIITLVYFIKSNNEVFDNNKEDNYSNELMEISKNLENSHPKIEFTEYEKDQEEKAIISYEELLEKSKTGTINYDEETDLDGLSIKKINMDEPISDYEDTPIESSVRLISYQNEENFLLALKQLQNLLN